ncbi:MULTISPECIES: hypothetical protein [Kitasatospora]|uniref:Uncharacterized protein n=1 Tax=Kitasatospora setae (strain ATCC 33774 / DSM 43861 / JCM 3304 / KCC A-0304 / NBRC 14216 / KM-6054) TaxID=452652 RepID=E4N1I3_KITSK|nr:MULTISPECIES: hypothetical protein [Kitasatospora]BAJ32017.1 hypothetical protein KSE_62540 [Kitasatospora setae KM-6054]
MLRSEADLETWFVRRKAARGAGLPEPGLYLSVSLRGTSGAAAQLVLALGRGLEDGLAELGLSAVRSRLVRWAEDRDEWDPVWTDESYRRFAAEGGLPETLALFQYWDVDGYPQGRKEAQARVALRRSRTDPQVWTCAVNASALHGDAERADRAGEVFARLLARAAEEPGVVYGALVYDRTSAFHTWLPYEKHHPCPEAEVMAFEVARGYYWANLLTERHVHYLGGPAALADRAAELGITVDFLTDRPNGGGERGPRVLVRDPAPLTGFDDARLAAMRDLLDPVLQHRGEGLGGYCGWPLRVLKEPGTSFREVPTDIEIPWFEDDGRMPEGGNGYRLVP